jgi:hypothetical protein
MERSYADFYNPGRWQTAKSWIKRRWKLVSGTVGAILLVYVVAIVNEVAPAPPLARGLVCQWQEWRAQRAPGTEFTILISNLANDSDGRQTDLVLRTFHGQTGIDVRRTCRVVQLDVASGSLADAEAEATAEGRALLDQRNADLLIWGGVIERNKELQLWFLSNEDVTTFHRHDYSLTEKYLLPIDFKNDFAEQLEAVAFSQLAVGDDPAERRLEKFRRLLSETSDDSLWPRGTALLYSFGRQAAALGTKKLDREWLEVAIAAYHKVLREWTRKRVPLAWAAVTDSLAEALVIMGAFEGNKVRLEQALVLYDESIIEWEKEKVLPRIVSIEQVTGSVCSQLSSKTKSTLSKPRLLIARC